MGNINNSSNACQELDKFKKNSEEIESTINSRLENLQKSKVDISIIQNDYINTMEHIGQISASNIKIKILAKKLEIKVITKVEKSFDTWSEQLYEKITECSEGWFSEHCPRKNRKKLVEDYHCQLNHNISNLLNQWISKDLEREILLYSGNIYESLSYEFEKLATFKIISLNEVVSIQYQCQDKARYRYGAFKQKETYSNLSYYGDDNTKQVGFIEGTKLVALDVFGTSLGAGVGTTVGFGTAIGGVMLGIGAGLVLPLIPVALITGTVIGAKTMTKNHSYSLEKEIKIKIIEIGHQQIIAALPKVKRNIISWINREVLTGVISCADDSFACAISQYENSLESLDRDIELGEEINAEVEQKLATLRDASNKLKNIQKKHSLSSSVKFDDN
jgi:hypothetical protein